MEEMAAVTSRSTWFRRFLLPGFAFKAVVIGGGYATGREIAEFFLPSGPWWGLAAMLLATVLWSGVAALTFALACHVGAYDYRTFFQALLGRAWLLFEVAFLAGLVVILAIFGAAAGEIGRALFSWPLFAGTLLLAMGITGYSAFGNEAIEDLFKYVSFLLYAVYALFLMLSLGAFGDRIASGFATSSGNGSWVISGITYAGYNITGAIVILPVLRHLTSRRDAVVSGLIAGPLAMAPAILFFVCMIAFYPGIANETLPSDVMLRALDLRWFQLLFQLMIFAALLESGAGAVHAVNERLATALNARGGRALGRWARGAIAAGVLAICMFIADRVGLVALIASGYRALAAAFILVYVVPLLTIGVSQLRLPPRGDAEKRIAEVDYR